MAAAPLGIAPQHVTAPMSDGSWASASDALEVVCGHHHDGHPHIAATAAEQCCQVRGNLNVGIVDQRFGRLEHNVTARAFLGVKPEVAAASVAEADLFVLAVIAADLDDDTIRGRYLKGRWTLRPLLAALFAPVGGGQ